MDFFDDFGNSHYGGIYTGIPDGNGGLLFYDNGELIDSTSFLSHNLDSLGSVVVHHTDNGGEHIFHNGILEHTATLNEHNGFDLYDGNGHYEASVIPNDIGGTDIHLYEGNVHDIIHYKDPLAYAKDCILPSCSLE